MLGITRNNRLILHCRHFRQTWQLSLIWQISIHNQSSPQKIEKRIETTIRSPENFVGSTRFAAFSRAYRKDQDDSKKHSDQHSSHVVKHSSTTNSSRGFGVQRGQGGDQTCNNQRQDQQLQHVHEELTRKSNQHDGSSFLFWVFDFHHALSCRRTGSEADDYSRNKEVEKQSSANKVQEFTAARTQTFALTPAHDLSTFLAGFHCNWNL